MESSSSKHYRSRVCLDECPLSMECGVLQCCLEMLDRLDLNRMDGDRRFRMQRLQATVAKLDLRFPDGDVTCGLPRCSSVISALTNEARALLEQFTPSEFL